MIKINCTSMPRSFQPHWPCPILQRECRSHKTWCGDDSTSPHNNYWTQNSSRHAEIFFGHIDHNLLPAKKQTNQIQSPPSQPNLITGFRKLYLAGRDFFQQPQTGVVASPHNNYGLQNSSRHAEIFFGHIGHNLWPADQIYSPPTLIKLDYRGENLYLAGQGFFFGNLRWVQ